VLAQANVLGQAAPCLVVGRGRVEEDGDGGGGAQGKERQRSTPSHGHLYMGISIGTSIVAAQGEGGVYLATGGSLGRGAARRECANPGGSTSGTQISQQRKTPQAARVQDVALWRGQQHGCRSNGHEKVQDMVADHGCTRCAWSAADPSVSHKATSASTLGPGPSPGSSSPVRLPAPTPNMCAPRLRLICTCVDGLNVA
jgi:hypothetical protein